MNLFDVEKYYSLAHCISDDKALGAGIAVQLRERFPNMIKWLDRQLCIIGGCYAFKMKDNYIFNVVTKHQYYDKPTYKNFKHALLNLRDCCIDCNVQYLAMPKIGCGLDRLDWNVVSEMIQEVFFDTNINIVVCNWKG